MEILVSTTFVKAIGMLWYPCASSVSLKNIYYFLGGGSFLDFSLVVSFIGHFSKSDQKIYLFRNFILSTWFYENVVVFIGSEKGCEPLSIFTELSNLCVEFGIDKGLALIRFSGEALIPPVVTCSVGFTEQGGTKNTILSDG